MRQFISAVAVAGAVGQLAAAQTSGDMAQCVKALPGHFNEAIVSCQVGQTASPGCLCKLSKTADFQAAIAKDCASVKITASQMSTYLCSLDGPMSSSTSAAPTQSASTSGLRKFPLGGRPMAPPTGVELSLGNSQPMIPATVNGNVNTRRGLGPDAMPFSQPQGDSQSQGFDINGFGVQMGGHASHSGPNNAGGLAHLHGDVQSSVAAQSSSMDSGYAYAQSSSAAVAAPSSTDYSATPSSNGLQHIHFSSAQAAYATAASSASSNGFVATSEASASASSSSAGYQHLGSYSASSNFGNYGDSGSGYSAVATPTSSSAAASASSDAVDHLFSVYGNAGSSVTPIAASSYAMQSSAVAAFAASSSMAASSSGFSGLVHNNPSMPAPTAAASSAMGSSASDVESSDAATDPASVHIGANGYKTQVVTETVTMTEHGCAASSPSGVPFTESNGPFVPNSAASASVSAPMTDYTPSPTPTSAQSTGVSPFPLFHGAGVQAVSVSKGLAVTAAGAFMALLILL